MATEPKTTDAAPDFERASGGRATSGRAGSGHTDQPTGQPAEQARESAPGATAAVGRLMGHGQDDALRAARLWAELMTQFTPFALLTAGRGEEDGRSGERSADPARFPAAAWAEAAFELVETALSTQRRYVDQVLSAQRQLVAQLLDTGAGIATATQAGVTRSGVQNLDDARTARR